MFDELALQRAARTRSHTSGEARETVQRDYLFRSRVHCGCGRQMFGDHRRRNYYMHWPRGNNRGCPDKYPVPPGKPA